MKKQLTAFAALAVAALLATTGCSSGSSGGGNTVAAASQPANPADLKANLTYSIWGSTQTEAAKQIITDFNKTYPNVHINVQTASSADYWTKLQTQASSNTLPDVFWMNGPNFQLYASNGKLQPLTGLIENKKIDPANYPKTLVDLYSWNGAQYGAPKDFDTIGIYINKKMFQDAGVAIPGDSWGSSWTWDEYNSAVEKLSATMKPQGKFAVAADVTGAQETYYNTIAEAGGDVISPDGKKSGYDTPETIKGLEFWSNQIAKGYLPTLAQQADTPALNRFISGQAAMLWGGDWRATQVFGSPMGEDVIAVPLPKDKKAATIIHGLSNVISAKTPNLAAAEAFVTYLAGKDAAVTYAKMAGIIPAFNGTQDTFLSVAPNGNLKVFLDGAGTDYAVPYPVSKNTSAWANQESTLLAPGFSGGVPMSDAAKKMADAMNAALAKE